MVVDVRSAPRQLCSRSRDLIDVTRCLFFSSRRTVRVSVVGFSAVRMSCLSRPNPAICWVSSSSSALISLSPLSVPICMPLSLSQTHTHTPTYLTLKACNDRSIVHSLHLKISPGFKFQTEVKLYSVQMFIYCLFIREDK